MNLFKRILSIVMVVLAVFCSGPFTSFADIEWADFTVKAQALESGNYTYTVENGEATITRLSLGYGTDLVIPSELDGYPVVALGDRFCSISSLKSLTIPDSVKSIGNSAFYNLTTTGYVTIGSGVETIGDKAFMNVDSYGFTVNAANKYFCNDENGVLYDKDKTVIIKFPTYKSGLSSYTMPSTVERIAAYAFDGASRLLNLTFSKNLKYIEERGVSSANCKISDLPEGLLEIGERAFSWSINNSSVTIPSTVTYIHPTAFMHTTSVSNINVKESNPYYSSESGVLFNKDKTRLITFPRFSSSRYDYTVPSTVETIGEYAFSESQIMGLTVPSSVKTIEQNAFYNCELLEKVTLSEGLETLGNQAFYFDVYAASSPLTSVKLPASLVSLGDDAFPSNCIISVAEGNANYSADSYGVLFNGDKTVLLKYPASSEFTEYVMPSSVVTINACAFEDAENLERVTLSDNLETIGEKAFYYCKALKVVASDSGSVKTIGNTAFYNCESLTSIFPLKNIEYIGSSAFGYCYQLKEITLYASLKEIGNSAFFCNSSQRLTDVYYTSTADAWKRVVIGTSNENLTNARFHFDTHIHEFGDWRIFAEPTCTEAGQNERVCRICNIKEYEDVAKLGHTFTRYISNNDATCEKLETETARCDRCPVKDTRSVAGTKLPHIYVTDEAVAATCETTGLTEGEHCESCNTVFVAQEETPVLGHSFTNYVYDNNADCLADGTKTAICDRDGCDKTNTVADEENTALGHNTVIDEAVEATCENTGLTEGSHCSGCGLVFVAQEEKAALGHIEVTDEAVAATCEKTGLTEGSHCSRCNEVLTAQTKISALGHVEVVDKAVTATCEKTGLTQGKHCSVCKKVTVEQRKTVALGHNYKTTTVKASATADGKTEAKCTRCAHIKSSTVYYKASNIVLSKSSYTYDGKVKKPTVTVKTSKGVTLKSGKDYTVKYSNSNAKSIGSYSVTVTFMGNYAGTKTLKYTIVPVGTSVKSLAAKTAGFTAAWNKQTKNTTGYQIQYSTSSSFKSSKTVTISKNKTLSKAVSGLKEKTKYYVRVRTYKTVSKTKYYSDWSKAKTVTTKPSIKITLNSTSLKVYVGETKTLKATTYPSKVTVTWKSSNKSVVSVSSGKIKALKKGSATITASFKYNGKTYKTTCKVTVSNPSVSLSKSKASLEAGQSLTLKATLKPSGGKVKWTTSNSKVATVSSKGKVTAKGMGSATITAAYTYKGKTYKKTCKITVTSLLKQLEQGFSAKLIIPSVGSATNSYCTVLFSNNTDYDVTLSMHVYANGKGCSNSSASNYVVKSGAGARASFYRDILPEYYYKTKDMYLDNYSTAWTIITVNGKKIYVKFDAQGNTRFGYTSADIDVY